MMRWKLDVVFHTHTYHTPRHYNLSFDVEHNQRLVKLKNKKNLYPLYVCWWCGRYVGIRKVIDTRKSGQVYIMRVWADLFTDRRSPSHSKCAPNHCNWNRLLGNTIIVQFAFYFAGILLPGAVFFWWIFLGFLSLIKCCAKWNVPTTNRTFAHHTRPRIFYYYVWHYKWNCNQDANFVLHIQYILWIFGRLPFSFHFKSTIPRTKKKKNKKKIHEKKKNIVKWFLFADSVGWLGKQSHLIHKEWFERIVLSWGILCQWPPQPHNNPNRLTNNFFSICHP